MEQGKHAAAGEQGSGSVPHQLVSPHHKVPVTMDPGKEEALAASVSPAWGRMVWTGALLRSFLTRIIPAACDCIKTA